MLKADCHHGYPHERIAVLPMTKFRLQTLMLVSVVVILGGTLTAIGLVAHNRLAAAGADLKARYDGLVSDAASQEVVRLSDTANRVLKEFGELREYRAASNAEFDPVKSGMGDCLRHTPTLTWLSYSSATDGEFTGFRRAADGGVILNRSNPSRDGGRPKEWHAQRDGDWEPLVTNLPGGYDPREKEWFRQAVAARGRVWWSEPYLFNEGERGITAAVACFAKGSGELLGVFTADYSLIDLSAVLKPFVQHQSRLVAVVTEGGEIVGAVSSLSKLQGDPKTFLGTVAAQLGQPLNRLPDGRPIAIGFQDRGEPSTAVYRVYHRSALPPFITVVVAPNAEFLGIARENLLVTLWIGAAAVAMALMCAVVVAGSLARPLEQVSRRLERVAQFHLPTDESPESIVREISIVGDSVDRMTAGLRSFGRYVPTALVRELLKQKKYATRSGEVRVLTILFADLTGFTSMSEQLTPEEVVGLLSEYFEVAANAIEGECGGTLDKFLGDGVLGFFNAPNDLADHARRGCLAALQLRDGLAARPCRFAGSPLRTRIGLHTGEALVGNIGTAERFAYTVLGDNANLASRLEGLNKLYGSDILASQETRDAAGSGFEWRRLDRVVVYGRKQATEVYELLGKAGGVSDEVLQRRDGYEAALAAYFAGDFTEAMRGFQEVAEADPEDKASAAMRDRCAALRVNGHSEGWNAVHTVNSK